MKLVHIILIVTVLLGLGLVQSQAAGAPAVYTQWTTNATDIAVPVQLYPSHMFVSRVTVFGLKTPRTVNVGNVYIGPQSGNDTQPIIVVPSGSSGVVIVSTDNTIFDLSLWYVDVLNVGDGVVVLFQ